MLTDVYTELGYFDLYRSNSSHRNYIENTNSRHNTVSHLQFYLETTLTIDYLIDYLQQQAYLVLKIKEVFEPIWVFPLAGPLVQVPLNSVNWSYWRMLHNTSQQCTFICHAFKAARVKWLILIQCELCNHGKHPRPNIPYFVRINI